MENKEKKPSVIEMFNKVQNITKDYKKSYTLIVIICMLAALFNSIAPFFLGLATDSLYDSFVNEVSFDMVYIFKIFVIVLGCYILNAICTYYKSYLSSELGQKIGYDLRRKLVSKINKIKL